MAAETSIGVGDLPAARRWGRQLRDLPLLAEVGHLATSRLLVADALGRRRRGQVLAGSDRFLDSWQRSGRPRAPSLGTAAAAVAMVHGLRGDDGARAEWLAVVDELGVPAERKAGYGPTFDAIVLLHHGQATRPWSGSRPSPTNRRSKWVTWIWLHWYVALRAEAAVLAGDPDARSQLAAARAVVAGNPVASAIVRRAEALLDGDRKRLLAAAAAFDAAGCRYQAARTLILAGGEQAARGAAALADLGLAPVEATPRADTSA